jgi:hypothetical protein
MASPRGGRTGSVCTLDAEGVGCFAGAKHTINSSVTVPRQTYNGSPLIARERTLPAHSIVGGQRLIIRSMDLGHVRAPQRFPDKPAPRMSGRIPLGMSRRDRTQWGSFGRGNSRREFPTGCALTDRCPMNSRSPTGSRPASRRSYPAKRSEA